MALGDWTSGWWYDKEGTTSPGDDHYSWSWISCSRQIAFWLGTRIDWVSSISNVSRGDVVYYDWTGDGSWDHVAIFAGTNSLGQKVIDAHTTDHYHWLLEAGHREHEVQVRPRARRLGGLRREMSLRHEWRGRPDGRPRLRPGSAGQTSCATRSSFVSGRMITTTRPSSTA